MSNDQTDLTKLTLKDLRALAGEHAVKNRSRLAKADLINALNAAIEQAPSADKSQPAAAETDQPKAKPATSRSAKPKDDKSAAKPAPVSSDDEPEVLDPAAIAALTGEPAPAAAAASPAADGDSGDERGADDDGIIRKRRRRRRGGRGRNRRDRDSDAEGQSPSADGDDRSEQQASSGSRKESSHAERGTSDTDADSSKPTKSDEAPSSSRSERSAPKKTDGRGSERRSDAKQRPERNEGQQRGDTASRPRAERDAPKVAAVLDRLRQFAGGVVELCDPDTPSWAQARLSELLAEAGVVPIPCNGKPHRDFHEILGQVEAPEVERDHIAVIEAPGFALRGDRGDLFPLRRAKVRIASGGKDSKDSDRSASDTAQSQSPTAEPSKERSEPSDSSAEPETEDKPETKSSSKADTQAKVDAEPEANAATESTSTAARRPTAETAKAETAKAETDSTDEETGRGRRRSRSRRSSRSDDSANNGDDSESDSTQPGQTNTADPARAAATLKPSDQAPSLPLEPQEAEELAARPKAEGWRHLGLHEQVLADLVEVGFEAPTPIQDQAINIAMSGKDMIGQSQTGSGKTAAFLLPMLHRLYVMEGTCPAALVMCPTRELARQVHAEFVRMAGKSGARAALIYGGVGLDDQFKALARQPHVVIGTPGRLIDHAKRRTLNLSNLAAVILDEADQMLDIGFLPDIEWVLKHSPPSRQMLLFSATMPDEIRKLASKHMHEPEAIHIAPKQVTADKVDQKYMAVDPDKKTSLLAHFIETYEPEQLVVFCNTKHQTDRVAAVLRKKNLSAQAIHGDLPQGKREKTLQGFRDGSLNCLIATNVAARGLDIPSVSHVVNYDIPSNPEEYVHRIGRTARMGRQGVARTFVTPEDGQFVVEIEKHIGILLEEEVVDGMTASTAKKPERTIANTATGSGPRLLKPLVGGIRLGRGRRR